MRGENLRFDEATLANGLRVIGEHNPNAATTGMGYLVHTGSRDETPEVAGVSHFLEHMVFKGNESYSAEDINRTFDELGAEYNAFTSEERTVYFGSVVADRAGALLDVLSELMRPSLRQADFDVEKKVILEEIAMYQDRPSRRLFEHANERFWNSHPLGNSVLGSTKSVSDLSRDQMKAYFDRRYAPGNVILAVAGNYDWDAVLAQATERAGQWPAFETHRDYPGASTFAGREEIVDANLHRLHAAYYAPGVAVEDPDRYAASLLASVIGAGDGSRLYWELVDKGLADNASLSHEAQEGAGSFVGYVSTDPERADAVLEEYLKVIRDAQEHGITQDEWRRAQLRTATGLTFRAETPMGRLMSFATNYQTLGAYQSLTELVNEVMETPLEAGARLLEARPFDRDYLVTLGPKD
ncbi:MAG: pitrilysin family protein [Truepera sp.]|jgi:predicted Zn-dependent peptidase|nr:pitrilysin family protein [Truepera sp.]